MVAEAGYMCDVAEQQRYSITGSLDDLMTATSKGKGEVTVTLDRVYLTAYRTHGSISFKAVKSYR